MVELRTMVSFVSWFVEIAETAPYEFSNSRAVMEIFLLNALAKPPLAKDR